MVQALNGVYRPRTPRSTSFYQLVQDHGERLKNAYPDQYEHQFGHYRSITEKVFFRYLDCGILRCGFARIHCDHCHSEYLLPFSCKTRSFCPSCHFSLRSMQALPGFHVHNEGKVVANDTEGRERLARYLIRRPVSLERLTYDREGQQVSYEGKTQTYTYQPLDFLAYVSLHIPDKGQCLH